MTNPTIWGPTRWRELHRKTATYPVKPNAQDKQNVERYFETQFEAKIPCGSCKEGYRRFKRILPVKYYVNSRKELMFWGYLLHNLVNGKLNKPLYPYSLFVEKYKS